MYRHLYCCVFGIKIEGSDPMLFDLNSSLALKLFISILAILFEVDMNSFFFFLIDVLYFQSSRC